MITFSATEALTPAIERTKRLLFSPFRWQTYLKLCAVAVFTEGFGGNFNFSSSSHSTASPQATSPSAAATSFSSFSLSPHLIALIVGVTLASLVVGFALFYLITRLRFALFYCLAYQVKEIRPGWRLYREPANRFFWLYMAVALTFMVLIVLSVAPFVFGFYRIYQQTHAGGHFDVLFFFSLFVPAIALLILIALVAVAIDITLRDFMLPHYALEDLSAGGAWRAVRARITAEKGAFILYAVLRIVLPIAAVFALVIVLAIPILLLLGIFVLVFAGFHVALPTAAGLRLTVEIMLGLTAAVIGILLAISFGGPLSIWVRNFALIFYGGRYPLLGDVLFPPPPPPMFSGDGMPTE